LYGSAKVRGGNVQWKPLAQDSAVAGRFERIAGEPMPDFAARDWGTGKLATGCSGRPRKPKRRNSDIYTRHPTGSGFSTRQKQKIFASFWE
jgi:hypothetical protein